MIKHNNIFLARKSNEDKQSINSQTKLNKKINNNYINSTFFVIILKIIISNIEF